MYSQNNEESIIKNYFSKHEFENKILSLLDIGANNGQTLSNSLACIERGWKATLIEPSLKSFTKLSELHKDNSKIELFNVAISTENGEVEFYESGEHAKQMYGENHSLLSSIKKEETERWVNETFTTTKVKAITIAELLKQSVNETFELITIDAEGMDFDILTQIDLFNIGCQMLIVENNREEEYKYIKYCENYGMRIQGKTYQNLIFVR